MNNKRLVYESIIVVVERRDVTASGRVAPRGAGSHSLQVRAGLQLCTVGLHTMASIN